MLAYGAYSGVFTDTPQCGWRHVFRQVISPEPVPFGDLALVCRFTDFRTRNSIKYNVIAAKEFVVCENPGQCQLSPRAQTRFLFQLALGGLDGNLTVFNTPPGKCQPAI